MFFAQAHRANTVSGIWFVAMLALTSIYLSTIPVIQHLGFSSLVLAIVIGMIYANTLRGSLPDAWVPGIQFSAKMLLRWGVALFGFRITFQQIFSVGLEGLVIDLIIIGLTLTIAWLIGTRLLGLDRETSLLIGAGAGICGAAAVLAAEGVTRSEPYKSAMGVATVVLFGTLSMFVYPLLYRAGVYHLMNLNQLGLYIGSTIHEVAQVVAAGNAVSTEALAHLGTAPHAAAQQVAQISAANVATTAVIVKMTRVLLLAPVLLILGALLSRGQAGGKKNKIVIPWFAVWFIVVIGIHSLPILPTKLIAMINVADNLLLTMAMGALGLETYWGKIKGVGAKGVLLGALLTTWLMIGGYFVTMAVTYLI